jgi:hypothetical protein
MSGYGSGWRREREEDSSYLNVFFDVQDAFTTANSRMEADRAGQCFTEDDPS